MYRLHQGDCIEIINTIENTSVDMILTDIPYNISRENNLDTIGRHGLFFGDWDTNFDVASLGKLVRVLKKEVVL